MPFVILGVGVLILFFTLLYFIYMKVYHTPDPGQNDPYRFPDNPQYAPYRESHLKGVEELLRSPYEKVETESYDGLKLRGKLFRFGDADAPLAICFHGWHGLDVRDFRGGVGMLRDMKYNVLLISERGHGDSEGHTLTYGVKERRDVLSWTNFALHRFGKDCRILLFGVSMGASTVLMASDLDLPPQVKGIIADAPYSSPRDIIRKVMKTMKISPAVFYPLVTFSGWLFGHVRINSASPMRSVQGARVPILIIHGEDDRFVPCEMSERIAAANPAIIRYTFPNAGHVLSYLTDEARYRDIAGKFLDSCLKDDKAPVNS